MSEALASPSATWAAGRKATAVAFGLLGVLGMAALTVYVAGALFLVMNKVDPRQAGLTSIVDYWDRYSSDGRLKKLVASITGSGVAVMIVLPVTLLAAARKRRPLHGDARFATVAEITRAGLLLDSGRTGGPSILLGRHRGRFLALGGQLSVMLSAPTRSGKGVGVVIPNLLNWPDSVVVLDIKGENHAITAGYRAERGQEVYAFSPFDDEARSHRWNPLTSIRTSSMHRVGDLLAVGQVFFPNDGSGTSSEAFFNDQARNLFLGLGLLLLESDLPRTIGEMLRQSSGKGRSLKDHLNGTIDERNAAGKPLTDECVDALRRLLTASENTLSSIVSTFHAPLTIFADAVVDAATSADDFSLADLRLRRMSVYVRIPPNRLANARPLLNLFFSQLVSLNTQKLPSEDSSLRLQCLVVNDEFAAMGKVGVITASAAFLAGYNLRLLTVVQAMSQLDAVYGDKEARTFATNHGAQILYAPREQRDADEYSAMLGHFTEKATSHGRSRSFGAHGHSSSSRNESAQRRALLLPQEFKQLGSERLVVIAEDCRPVLGEKIRYHRDPVFTQRLRPAPPVQPMRLDLHKARVEERWVEAPDDLPEDTALALEAMAHDVAGFPRDEGSASELAESWINFFPTTAESSDSATGGVVEAIPDEDGVFATKPATEEPSLAD